jgi:polyhydroxybutyrate depolymerase
MLSGSLLFHGERTGHQRLDQGGRLLRSFQFVKPARALSDASLVFVLHGSGGSGKDNDGGHIGSAKTTANENVIFVYADGYKHYWNECRKAAALWLIKLNINEEAFFSAMIDYFASNIISVRIKYLPWELQAEDICVNKLAMTMPKKIRAITAIIANLPDTDNFDCVDSKIADSSDDREWYGRSPEQV